MVTRALVAAGIIVAAGIYASGASAPERVPARDALATTPVTLARWEGRDVALDDDVIAQLGVDDYINRRYIATDAPPVALYVGYYASQRQGDTVHSPQNCLPGAGWQPVTAERTTLDVGRQTIPVNRFIIQKGIDRQAVFYWYQGRSRVLASELANKAWLMLDAARLRRTDGGLVRVITPVASTPDAAFAALSTFSTALFPYLSSRLP
jgi:EpsI family protein